MSKPANRDYSSRTPALSLPPVVAALLDDSPFREYVAQPPRRGRIGTAGEFVVVGVMDYLDAGGGTGLNVVTVVGADEDPAVVQMCAAKDLLPVTKNELAMGRAYLVVEEEIGKLPKQNTRNDRRAHKKKYGVQRSERLDAMWGKLFGVSKTTLRRYARALDAPAEVRRLFLAGHMDLDDVLTVVAAGPGVGRNVERDLLSGTAVGDALERRLGNQAAADARDEPPQNKDTIIALVKSLNRWSKLFDRTEEKRPELTREQDRALRKAEELIAWLRRKVG